MARAVADPHTWTFVLLGGVIICATLVLSQFLSWMAIFLLVMSVAAGALVIANPSWGVFALAFLAPMSGLVIDFSRDQSLSRLPIIGSINAPLVDLYAIALLLLVAVLFLIRPDKIRVEAPTKFWQLLGVFYGVVALSAVLADPLFFGTTAKAFFRPYLFMYLGFAVPVLLIIRSRVDQMRALFAYECAAVLGAVMGAISLVSQQAVGFARATPFALGGYTPFGVNHNVLGESLSAIVPFAWWFAARHPRSALRAWLFAAAGLITTITLLTFSRAAWIVLAFQAIGYFWWRGGQKIKAGAAARGVFAVALALGLFFVLIQSTFIATSSDNTRKDLLGIAITYWHRAPWFGQGPGMYVPLVSETVAFKMDYGQPMDAHGTIQKLMLETGTLGVIAFGIYVAFIARALWIRRGDEFHFMLLVTFISMWGYQLFNTGYFDGKVWVLMGLIIAAIL